MNNDRELMRKFLENNDERRVDIEDNLDNIFYKITLKDNFDFIYSINTYDGLVSLQSDAHFCGMIDRRTQKLYFAGYSLTDIFMDIDKGNYETTLQYTSENELEKAINSDIEHALEKMANKITNDMGATEKDIRQATELCIDNYYCDTTTNFNYIPTMSETRTTKDFLDYLTNPSEFIEQLFKKQEQNEDERCRPTYIIKHSKMMNSLREQILKEIETSPKYKNLRQAKKIKNAIPQNAKQVNLFYLLKNGEVLSGKFEAKEILNYYYFTDGTVYYFVFGYELSARDKFKEIEGNCNKLYVSNIVKITYNDKEIYTNPEHTTK